MKKNAGKKLKAAYESVDRTAFYSVEEAVKIIKKAAKGRKFDETVEIAMNLNVDPRHADQNVRGMFTFPHGTGASARVAVFAKGDKAEEAKAAGADIVGADDLAETIQEGTIDFDRCIATPDMMPLVGKLGKVLGPQGLMPNPKLGTVTPDVKKAVEDAKGGAIEYRAEKAGIVQAAAAKASFDEKQIIENVTAFINEVKRVKPSGVKGTYIRKVTLTSTMGPGIKIDMTGFEQQQQAA